MAASSAAFFRVEGTLLRRPTALTTAWFAANAQELGSRLLRLGGLAMAAPVLGADPGLGRRLQWSALRGTSEDRLVVLGEEYYATWLKDAILPVGRDLLARARHEGRQVVLVSDNLDVVIRHLARDLGVSVWRANRMELRGGRATGRLLDPVVSTLSGTELHALAEELGCDLRRSCGYGARAEDAVLLSAVGLPCAVAPDRALRRLAMEHGWPVVNA